MYYNLIDGKDGVNATQSSFLGLNRTVNGGNGEFFEMENLSSDKYPCLSTSKGVREVISQVGIRAVIAPQYSDDEEVTSFTGVAGDQFYYNGAAAEFEEGIDEIPEGDITLVDFNGKICINVYNSDDDTSVMLYYDYTDAGGGKVKKAEKGVINKTCTVYSSGNPETDAIVTNYISSSGINWEDYFSEGDSVFISGFSKEENNTVNLDSRYKTVEKNRPLSCTVEKIDGNKLYLQLFNYLGEVLVFTEETSENVSVETIIPTMNHICIHNNRLWGTNPNGEYVYASKQADCFNFNSFQGLANDSYYCEVGTHGGFVGIVSYRDNLVAFKRDYIHHIYGDKPSNFTMPKQLSDCGCIDIKSAVQISTSLYFLGYGGFYIYTGGQPELISRKLDRKYKNAVGMTDGNKYIVSATQADGTGELLVLDTVYGLWHKESYIDAVGYFRWHDKLYISSSDAVYIYGGGEYGEWSCESVAIYEDTFDNKGMSELWIRAKIDKEAEIEVYTSSDGGDWLLRTTLESKGMMKVYRIPIRFIDGEFFAYKLVGKGGAVIHDIERVVSVGGRQYRRQ